MPAMKEHELKIRLAANGEEGCGLTQGEYPADAARPERDCTALSGFVERTADCSAAGVGFDRPEK